MDDISGTWIATSDITCKNQVVKQGKKEIKKKPNFTLASPCHS
jgi:hypothetical protein